MRHNIKGRKLNRKSSHLSALLRNLAAQLIEHEQIITTVPKAKELRPYVEKLVTLAKEDTLHNRRQALGVLYNNAELTEKLFTVLGKRYKERPGGYTRIMRAGFRQGDAAPRAVIEFVDRDIAARGKKDIERLEAESAALNAEAA